MGSRVGLDGCGKSRPPLGLKIWLKSNKFLTLVLFTFSTCCVLSCLVCIVAVVLCVLLSSYVYLLYCVCIAVFYFRCRTAG